jgi:hypothetical protein
MPELLEELRSLESETFEIEDIDGLDNALMDIRICSCSTSTSSCCSCSTSGCSSCSTSTSLPSGA